ncbi:MAG: zeta toxin family protein, partial [Atribacterota bacterium]|nr:zeta toxin family protein [Atribacterota bacterium]
MAAADPQKHQLSEAEHQRIFDERIKPEIFAGAKTLERPTAVIFGGQPGAGKSTGVDAAKNELQSKGGAVEIIGDDMRGFHPSYGSLMAQDDKTAAFYTDRDSGKWVEKAIAEAKRLKVNVVIEGTMRDGNTVAKTMNGLRTAGYEIDARVVAVNYQFSEQGILQRYEAQKADRGAGRMTAPEAHRAAYDGMLATIDRIEGEKLADRLSVYRRGNEVIYTNEVKGGEWVHEPKARAVVQSERDRSMTLQE